MTNSLEAVRAAKDAKEDRALKKRIAMERTIVRRVIRDALNAGYALGVHNGGDSMEIENEKKFGRVVGEMFATDVERLYFYKEGKAIGWVLFVYGNDGWDVICDYTVNLEDVLAGASAVADKFELES